MKLFRDEYHRGIALLIGGATLWSLGGVLIRWLSADELTIIFWRSVFASVFLGLYIAIMDKRYGNVLPKLLGLGMAGYLVALCYSADTMLFVFALERTTVANAVVIFATTPVIAALLSRVVLGEPLSASTWLALLFAGFGVAWMVSASFATATIVGDALAMVIAVLFAIPIVIIRKYPHIDVISAVLLSAVVTACICLPFATFVGVSAKDMGLLAIFGIFEYGVALVIFSIGVKYVPVVQSSLLGLLEVVLAPLWVWLFVNEVPSGRTLFGGTLVLSTLVIYTISQSRTAHTIPAQLVDSPAPTADKQRS